MTITKNENIRVVADPFNISDKFQHDLSITKSIEIYQNFIFTEYALFPSSNDSQKNSTYDKIEIKTTKKDNNLNMDANDENRILSFRITKDELNKLNELLFTNFESSEHLIIKATSIPDFMKNKSEAKNYTNSFLSIFDKSSNSTKSGILFKPLKKPFKIRDYEDEMDNDDNELLGKFLYSNIIKTKIIRKFASLSSKNINKILNLFFYKEKDLKENNVKSYLFFVYLGFNIILGKYIQNDENNENPIEFKKIYKIQINSEILMKILKNFNNDINNPDYISVWTKGLVFKTNFTLRNSYEEPENNNNNNSFYNEGENLELNDNQMNESKSYMIIKAFHLFEKDAEIIDCDLEEEGGEEGIEKKKFVLNLIENNVDDKHEELNKSLELNDYDDRTLFRGNNSFMDENEEENEDDIRDNNDDEDEDNKKEKNLKKEKYNRNKKKSNSKNKEKKRNLKNIDEDEENKDKENLKNDDDDNIRSGEDNSNNESDPESENEKSKKNNKKNKKAKSKSKEKKSKKTKKTKKNK